MTDILSQAEIDELLSALAVGEDDAQEIGGGGDPSKVKTYDFRTANKFPKEHIRTLNMVFENFAQLLVNQLSGTLRATCECEVLSIEEISFNELNNSLPTPVILLIYEAAPMVGSQMIEISPEAAYLIVNRLLGGAEAGHTSNSQFTEIELAIIERVFRQLMRVFDDSWDKVFEVRSKVDRIETSSQFAQIVPLNEPVAVVTLNLKLGEDSGLISVCIPHSSIEPVNKKLNSRMLYSSHTNERRTEAMTAFLADRLVNTSVSLTAFFNDTPATVSDILNLQPGDVIRLDHKVSEPLLVRVQHIPKFSASIGSSGSKYAVKLTEIIEEGRDDESFSGRD